ncbi:MAG: DNA helicase PcrA [Armatimonadetes bacterium]|nr:DNA helicase PcrA [Armatimonadota bacterium]
MDILSNLNDEQQEAVIHPGGPLLIFAGAGSGKTRVLTHRVAYLIRELGVPPRNILCVTFTNKAAGEMRERINGLIGRLSFEMWVGTFHATCARMLREHGDKIGLDRNFVVFDTGDQNTLVKECLTQMDLDDKQFPPRQILDLIGKAKEEMISPRDFLQYYSGHFEEIAARVYRLYQEKLHQSRALDFDDLIYFGVRLLEERADVLEHYQDKFRHILVDEYQDINMCQYKLVKNLAAQYRNLCVVGDDDQSIYGWRGADVKLILAFEQDYPDAKVVKLEQNYRSTQRILDAAFHVVRNNRFRKDKQLWTQNAEGEHLILFEAGNEQEEAAFVAGAIRKKMLEEKRSLKEFAILYRTNAQSRVFEEVFINHQLPYKIVGGLRFYERKEVKDIIAYLRLLHNPHDGLSLRRVINVPARGIGTASVDKVAAYASLKDISLYEAVLQIEQIAEIQGKSRKAIKEFADMIELLRRYKDQLSVPQLLAEVIDRTGYIRQLKEERSIEAQTRIENIQEFVTAAKEFDTNDPDKTLRAFLEQVALMSDVDSYDTGSEAVVLMTLHSAKGLEFPVVFMVGMEEGIFPHSRSLWDDRQLEEERRLCYVGITRAREQLYLTYAWRRTLWGATQTNRISRFLQEVPNELFAKNAPKSQVQKKLWDEPAPAQSAPTRTASERHKEILRSVFPEDEQEGVVLKPGDKVRHSKFGEGLVLNATGSGSEAQVSVHFPDYGVKKLMLAWAKLEKV